MFFDPALQSQREKEQLHKWIIELESKLNQKQTLELEVERMKGAIEVMRHMTEEGDTEAQNKKKFLEEKLKDKEEELDVLDRTNQNLIVKEKLANDELQEARKKLIHVCLLPYLLLFYNFIWHSLHPPVCRYGAME